MPEPTQLAIYGATFFTTVVIYTVVLYRHHRLVLITYSVDPEEERRLKRMNELLKEFMDRLVSAVSAAVSEICRAWSEGLRYQSSERMDRLYAESPQSDWEISDDSYIRAKVLWAFGYAGGFEKKKIKIAEILSHLQGVDWKRVARLLLGASEAEELIELRRWHREVKGEDIFDIVADPEAHEKKQRKARGKQFTAAFHRQVFGSVINIATMLASLLLVGVIAYIDTTSEHLLPWWGNAVAAFFLIHPLFFLASSLVWTFSARNEQQISSSGVEELLLRSLNNATVARSIFLSMLTCAAAFVAMPYLRFLSTVGEATLPHLRFLSTAGEATVPSTLLLTVGSLCVVGGVCVVVYGLLLWRAERGK